MSKFFLIPTLIMLVTFGCAPITVTSTDYSDVDFGKLKTYSWGRNVLKIDENGRMVNKNSDKIEAMADKNIQPITDAILSEKGFKLVHDGRPDFYVRYIARGRGQSTLPQDVRSVTYENNKQIKLGTFLMGSLSISMIDGKQNKVIWRGLAETPVTGTGENTKRLEKVINKILKDFPPTR
ncbi:MAG: DUF4136 domain-containing protein [Gammaproteobacteria bacterium]|jgi:hypothetical protein